MSASKKSKAGGVKKAQSTDPTEELGVPTGLQFWMVMHEGAAIEVNGTTVMMTRWEVLLRNLALMAHNDPVAARLLHRVRRLFPGGSGPGAKSILVLTENQMKY